MSDQMNLSQLFHPSKNVFSPIDKNVGMSDFTEFNKNREKSPLTIRCYQNQ